MYTFKILTVTKDEYDLIEDFILYHGSHFGYDNIIIIDNGSTHPHVLEIYETYKPKGIQVFVEYGYHEQGIHFTKYIQQVKDQCDWCIPLDTDNFLTVSGETTELRKRLSDLLSGFPDEVDILNVSQHMSVYHLSDRLQADRPARELIYWWYPTLPQPSGVHIARAKNFVSTGPGTHTMNSLHNHVRFCPQIELFHYHCVGAKRTIERARTIVIGYHYISVDDNDFTIFRKLSDIYPYSNGFHRIDQYRNFIHKKIICDWFIQTHHRLPTLSELHDSVEHVNLDTIGHVPPASFHTNPDMFTRYEQLLYHNSPVDVTHFSRNTAVRDYLESLKT